MSLEKTDYMTNEKLILATNMPLSSLSYTIAALNPAFCALLTLSSKLHPPLIIRTNGELEFAACSTIFVKVEHASIGSATYNTPHSPDPLTGGAEKQNETKQENVSTISTQDYRPVHATRWHAHNQHLSRI